jgi:hypothetical protein
MSQGPPAPPPLPARGAPAVLPALQLVQLQCPACGGALQLHAGSPIATCPYCDARIALVAQQGAAPVSLAGDDHRVVPFSVDKAAFREAFLRFLAEGAYTPADVFALVEVRETTGLFAAMHLVEGTTRAAWTAAAGFARQEQEVVMVSKTVNGQRQQVPEVRQREVIDWRPVSGELLYDHRLLLHGGDELPALAAGLLERADRLPPTAELAPLLPDALRGAALEPFTREPEAAMAAGGLDRLRAEVMAAAHGRVPGDRKKDVRVDLRRGDERWLRLHLPVWIAVYHYQNQSYLFAMDGRDGAVAGTRPEDKAAKAELEGLTASLNKAKVAAIAAGILSFFVLPFIGAAAVFVAWHLLTADKRAALAAAKARLEAARAQREAALQRARLSPPG